ncbi:ankyrin repeat-containing domain protein [Lasiosphaeria hispida]|uniref:Ankyrin repeat-containing domain protein n=1 Tax=Lasiosphaeria hispida TaxID=260671 RepID=A0AAJ0HCK6_9PEZI|nr:ankyrin repeat-containing domain protein [Lasiosphaeria hispida]
MNVPRQGLEVLVSPKEKITADIVAVPGLGADPSKSFGSGDSSHQFNWLRDDEGIPGDFPSARDDRYKATQDHLQHSMQAGLQLVAKRLRDSKHSVVSDEEFSRAIKILGVTNHEHVLQDIEDLSGNSSWILEDKSYRQWVEQASEAGTAYQHGFLWACGTDESGKSKAALAVIDDIKRRARDSEARGASGPMVAYFFCDPKPGFSSAEAVVKSFMWQLILQKRTLGQYVRELITQTPSGIRGRRGPEEPIAFSKLWVGLAKIIEDESVQEIVFVINNIHRLDQGLASTDELLGEISTLLRTEPGGCEDPLREKVRWVILSSDRDKKFNPALQEREGARVLRIGMAGSGNQFVRSFIRDEVEDLADRKGYSLALRYYVLSTLNEMAPSSTTWVEVVCSLLGELSPDFILKLKKHDENIHTTKEILRTLAVAYEDPTLAELRVLAGLVVRSSADDPGETENEIRRMIRACGPLLKLHAGAYDTSAGHQETKVGFIHSFAKDTLLEPEIRQLIFLDSDGRELQWQHGIVGLRCFSHMLKELGAGRDDGDDGGAAAMGMTTTSAASSAAEIDALFDGEGGDVIEPDAVAALGYPLKYWLKHGNKATSDFVPTLGAGHIFWSPDSRTRRRWWCQYTQGPVDGELEDVTALHVAAYFGVLPLVTSLLDHGHEEELRCPNAQSHQPLHLAAANGHVEVCELLLERGADVNSGLEARKPTPLHMTASMGHIEVVELLVKHGATIDAVAEGYGTPLALALSQRQTETAERLLERGADPALTEDKSESPLAAAALRGYDDLVEKLLAANPALIHNSGALAAAASAGNVDMVKTLLPLDNDWESRGRALARAASSGFDDVVGCLLQTGSPGPPCDKAFQLAAAHGHEDVVTMLWQHHEKRPAISSRTINQALYDATVAQHEQLVTYLVETCGADANDARGEEFGDALTASAFNGSEPTLQALLRHGANVNAPEGRALQTAVLRGCDTIIQTLLEHGADPNAWSDAIDPKTALQAACNTGRLEIAKMLIVKGADTERGGGIFSKPLIAATSRGYAELVRLLLGAGANPNIFGGPDKSTPLINAAMTLPEDVLGLLIDRGAAVDEKDPAGDTALIAAAWVGDCKSVALLLDRGADIHIQTTDRGSALHAAASRGHVEVCQLLLARGADPTARCGPFATVLQAAAASGHPGCVEAILGQERVQVNARGGKHFTALHAAAVHGDDRCLRLLLARNPDLNVASPPPPGAKHDKTIGTPLQAAAFAGCSRNARLLLDAGADPNIIAGKHGTALQAAALKCRSRLCAYLLDRGAQVDGLSGKRADAGKDLAKLAEIKVMMEWIRSQRAELVRRRAARKDQPGSSPDDGYDSDFGGDVINKHQDIYDTPGAGQEQADPFAPWKTQPGAVASKEHGTKKDAASRGEQSNAKVPAEDQQKGDRPKASAEEGQHQQRVAGKRAETPEPSRGAEVVGGPDTAATAPPVQLSPATSLSSPPPLVGVQGADSGKWNSRKIVSFSGMQRGLQEMKDIPSIKGMAGMFGKK